MFLCTRRSERGAGDLSAWIWVAGIVRRMGVGESVCGLWESESLNVLHQEGVKRKGCGRVDYSD